MEQYQGMQHSLNKDAQANLNLLASELRDEFQLKFQIFEKQNQFMQNEVYNLLSFQDTLKEMGLLNEKGFLNRIFLVNLKEINEAI